VLRVALQTPELVPEEWYELTEDDLTHPVARAVFVTIQEAGGVGVDLAAILEAAPDDELRGTIRGLAVEEEPVPIDEVTAAWRIRTLVSQRVEAEARELRDRLQTLHHERDREELLAVQRELRARAASPDPPGGRRELTDRVPAPRPQDVHRPLSSVLAVGPAGASKGSVVHRGDEAAGRRVDRPERRVGPWVAALLLLTSLLVSCRRRRRRQPRRTPGPGRAAVASSGWPSRPTAATANARSSSCSSPGRAGTRHGHACPGIGFSEDFTVAPGEVTTVEVPTGAMLTGSGVQERGVRVEADTDVSVYGMNQVPSRPTRSSGCRSGARDRAPRPRLANVRSA
jgi:hypothetical protein